MSKAQLVEIYGKNQVLRIGLPVSEFSNFKYL